jgi:hypothetical protein
MSVYHESESNKRPHGGVVDADGFEHGSCFPAKTERRSQMCKTGALPSTLPRIEERLHARLLIQYLADPDYAPDGRLSVFQLCDSAANDQSVRQRVICPPRALSVKRLRSPRAEKAP